MHSTQPVPLGLAAVLIPSLTDFIGSSLTSSCFNSALPDHCNGLSLSNTKRRLQAQVVKVSHFPQREIRAQAEVYLCAHRETLIAEARVTVDLQRLSLFYVTLKMGLEMIVGYARVSTDGRTLDAQQAPYLRPVRRRYSLRRLVAQSQRERHWLVQSRLWATGRVASDAIG
jgi:hypothetical protein